MYIKILFLLLLPLAASAQKNIIFIFADDMGWGDISYYGTKFSTPIIDSLFAQSAVFSNFYVQPACTPSRTALQTGQYPARVNGMQWDVILHYEERGLPNNVKILPQYLKEAGYTNYILGKWHIGHAHPEFMPQARGYDRGFYSPVGTGFFDYHDQGPLGVVYDGDAYSQQTGPYADDVFVDTLLTWMEGNVGSPFFMYAALHTPHRGADTKELEAPDSLIAMAPTSGYTTEQKTRWAMMKTLDNNVGRIWQKVIDLGIENETIIIFTSDNGGDTNYSAENGPFRGGKRFMLEGGTHVPMAWFEPGVTTGTTVDTVLHLVDLLPTLVEGVAGQQIGSNVVLDGINFSPLVRGDPMSYDTSRAVVVTMIPARMWAIRKGRWKLMNNEGSTAGVTSALSESLKLYDVVADPGEVTDLSATYPDVVTDLYEIATYYKTIYVNTYGDSRFTAPPSGWIQPACWSVPQTFYDPDYYYYRE